MNRGFAASMRSVSRSTPTALLTPGVVSTWWTWASSRLEYRISDTPFWATVKSAWPRVRTAAADCSRLLLTTVRVTTVMTAMPMAKAMPNERAFLNQMFSRINLIRGMPLPYLAGARRLRGGGTFGPVGVPMADQ